MYLLVRAPGEPLLVQIEGPISIGINEFSRPTLEAGVDYGLETSRCFVCFDEISTFPAQQGIFEHHPTLLYHTINRFHT